MDFYKAHACVCKAKFYKPFVITTNTSFSRRPRLAFDAPQISHEDDRRIRTIIGLLGFFLFGWCLASFSLSSRVSSMWWWAVSSSEEESIPPQNLWRAAVSAVVGITSGILRSWETNGDSPANGIFLANFIRFLKRNLSFRHLTVIYIVTAAKTNISNSIRCIAWMCNLHIVKQLVTDTAVTCRTNKNPKSKRTTF